MKFCYLPKDQKTFNILKLYISIINQNNDSLSLFKEDSKLQIKEIIEHNKRNEKDESISWICSYGGSFRSYLNTIKELAIMFIITNSDVTWENFEFYCDKMNLLKDKLLEKIF